jgi:LysM domain
MSAMPALDWPEDEPASWPVASWTVPAQPTRTETVRAHTVRAQAPRGQAVRAQVVRIQPTHAQEPRAQEPRAQALGSQALGSQAPRVNAAPAPLRLTTRGRIVLVAAAALLVTLLSLLATGAAASATSHTAPSRGADRNLAQVLVLPGQSLWSVAETADPNADPQQVMQQIIDLNGLSGDVIQAGQQLWVPRG